MPKKLPALGIGSATRRFLNASERACEEPCCGAAAYRVTPHRSEAWLRSVGREAGARALAEINGLLADVATRADDERFIFLSLQCSAVEIRDWLLRWQEVLNAAMLRDR